jgi:hypothetical protein
VKEKMSKKDELINAIRKLVVDREQSWVALLAAGASWGELRSAGASCSELRAAGASCSELRSAGASWVALRAAGASWVALLAGLDDLPDDQLESIKESLENAAKPKV